MEETSIGGPRTWRCATPRAFPLSTKNRHEAACSRHVPPQLHFLPSAFETCDNPLVALDPPCSTSLHLSFSLGLRPVLAALIVWALGWTVQHTHLQQSAASRCGTRQRRSLPLSSTSLGEVPWLHGASGNTRCSLPEHSLLTTKVADSTF
jgi:hypothetical protein